LWRFPFDAVFDLEVVYSHVLLPTWPSSMFYMTGSDHLARTDDIERERERCVCELVDETTCLVTSE